MSGSREQMVFFLESKWCFEPCFSGCDFKVGNCAQKPHASGDRSGGGAVFAFFKDHRKA
jgi:hypothetical protein